VLWLAGREVVSGRSGDSLVEDGSSPFQGKAASGFEEVCEGLGGAHQGLDDVECVAQALVEETEMAGGAAPGIDQGIAPVLGIAAEPEGRIAAGPGEDGGGEESMSTAPEDGAGTKGAGVPFPAPKQAIAGAEDHLDDPGPSDIGLGSGGRLVPVAKTLQELGDKSVGNGGARMVQAAHKAVLLVRGQARR
jgi:hypothetical protein